MEQKIIRKVLKISGMTCTSCEMRIENTLKKLDGVVEARAMYASSNVYVTYDAGKVTLNKIVEAVEAHDYSVVNKPGVQKEDSAGSSSAEGIKGAKDDKFSINQLIGIGIILLAGYIIIKNTVGFDFIPEIKQNMGFGILFAVGLLTSLHCIAMCGGINLSQCVSYKFTEKDTGKITRLKPSLMYNGGRVVSYTVIGGIVGALGSVVSFSGTAKGIVAVVAGVFMVIMGLNMLNIFPWLRKLNPRMPRIFGNKIHNSSGRRNPFYVGLLNGLMPCGPLQAMQLYALGTGSFFTGAASMFFFSMGTVPLMFGFGALSSLISGKFTRSMMKVSAIFVIVLGVIMANRGLSLSGMNLAFAASGAGSVARVENGVQYVETTLQSGKYAPLIVQKGIPVKWTVKVGPGSLNGCNNPVTIPVHNLEKRLVEGDNLIEFTPEETGNITYTCWMGMISGNIKVVDNVSAVSGKDLEAAGGNAGTGAGGCCAAGSKATRFADGKVPTDEIGLALIKDGKQEVEVRVDDYGYSPAVIVVQKGMQTKIKFNTKQLNSCNNVVVFPEFQGQLDLNRRNATPLITPERDFTFECWMGMLHGYVKVVDDINKVDLDQLRKEVDGYTPAGGGGGCCAR